MGAEMKKQLCISVEEHIAQRIREVAEYEGLPINATITMLINRAWEEIQAKATK